MCTLAAGRARGKHGIPLGGRGKGWLMKVATVPASPKWGGGAFPLHWHASARTKTL